jgi:hypothetical protein
MGEVEGTIAVIGKGYNERGERCYLVGHRDGKAYAEMALVEVHDGDFFCNIHGQVCPHIVAVNVYLQTIDDWQQEIRPGPGRKSPGGADCAGKNRIYLTMLPPSETTH